MKLLVGLGNPGTKYFHTRHNAGYLFLDYLSQKISLGQTVKTLKPDTYMNQSGQAVAKAMGFFKLSTDDLLVVHDDLDLRLGEFKLQFGKGPKQHNGVESIEQRLGTTQFWRLRLGIDNREAQKRTPGESYVLQNFSEQELKILQSQVFPPAAQELSTGFINLT